MTTPSDPFAEDTGPSASAAGVGDGGPLAGCEWLDSVAAELALGSLSGAARSAALGHLDGCDDCRAFVESLSTAADALLLVAPEVDAPAGFEVRLLARLRADEAAAAPTAPVAPVVPIRRRARAVFAAAAAAIVIAGAGVGVGVAVAPNRAQPAASSQVRVATLRSGTRVSVGDVVLTAGSPSWVVMTFHRPGWSGWVYCVVTENGKSQHIGSFFVHDGVGSWAVRLSGSASAITTASVQAPSGSVVATAEFAT